VSTDRERILKYLAKRPEGASDAEVAQAAGLAGTDEADRQCRLLAEEGLIERRQVGRALLNLLRDDCPPEMLAGPAEDRL
jgi:DNA-binding IclR family transcriptional regulator